MNYILRNIRRSYNFFNIIQSATSLTFVNDHTLQTFHMRLKSVTIWCTDECTRTKGWIHLKTFEELLVTRNQESQHRGYLVS